MRCIVNVAIGVTVVSFVQLKRRIAHVTWLVQKTNFNIYTFRTHQAHDSGRIRNPHTQTVI